MFLERGVAVYLLYDSTWSKCNHGHNYTNYSTSYNRLTTTTLPATRKKRKTRRKGKKGKEKTKEEEKKKKRYPSQVSCKYYNHPRPSSRPLDMHL